jgi:putative hydrolase of the HAD superfamily
MTYKAIGFDYGGVIGGVNTLGVNFTKKACELLEVDPDEYSDVYFSLNHLINLGEVATWPEFWKIFVDKLGKPEKLDALLQLNKVVDQDLLIVDQRMPLLIDQLRESGYRTGLLSNAAVQAGQHMREQGLDKHFDVFHISAETKLMKPNPRAFNKLANELQVNINELIFIDDAPKSLSTAVECGFTPILFTSFEKLLHDLTTLGISVSGAR